MGEYYVDLRVPLAEIDGSPPNDDTRALAIAKVVKHFAPAGSDIQRILNGEVVVYDASGATTTHAERILAIQAKLTTLNSQLTTVVNTLKHARQL